MDVPAFEMLARNALYRFQNEIAWSSCKPSKAVSGYKLEEDIDE